MCLGGVYTVLYSVVLTCGILLTADIRRFCVAVQKRVLDGVVDREVEKGNH